MTNGNGRTVWQLADGLKEPFFVPRLSKEGLKGISACHGTHVVVSSVIPLLDRSNEVPALPLGTPFGLVARLKRAIEANRVFSGGKASNPVYCIVPVLLEAQFSNVDFEELARQAAWRAEVVEGFGAITSGLTDCSSPIVVFDFELVSDYKSNSYVDAKNELIGAFLEKYAPSGVNVRVLSAFQIKENEFAGEESVQLSRNLKDRVGFVFGPNPRNLLGQQCHEVLWKRSEGQEGRIPLLAGIEVDLLVPKVRNVSDSAQYSALRSLLVVSEMAATMVPDLVDPGMVAAEAALRKQVGEVFRDASELTDLQVAHAATCRELVCVSSQAILNLLAPTEDNILERQVRIMESVPAVS